MANSITFKPVVFPHQRRSDGSCNVKIRVTFKRQTRYISTNITATSREFTADGELKARPNALGYVLIRDFQKYTDDLNYYSLQAMDVDDVIAYIHRQGKAPDKFRLDLYDFAEREFLPGKKQGTADTYRSALNALKRFTKTDHLDVNDITKDMLVRFADHLNTEPKQNVAYKTTPKTVAMKKKGVAARLYISRLRTVVEAAKDMYNDEDNGIIPIPKDPFSRIHLPIVESVSHCALNDEFIQKVINEMNNAKPCQRLALEAYLISFGLMGMNVADMLTAPPAKNGVLTYRRQKTRDRRFDHAEISIKIDERIMPLIRKHYDPEGRYMFDFHLYFKDNQAMTRYLVYSYRAWAKKVGVPRFTFYSARHTWATLARSSKCGVDKGTVDDCLNHTSPESKLLDVYAEKDWSVLWNANSKVLDLFDWSPLEDDVLCK